MSDSTMPRESHHLARFAAHDLRLVTVGPDDIHRVQQLVEACSHDSQYARFHMGIGRVSTRFAQHLCDFDGVNRIGFALEAPDRRLVAHASLLPDDPIDGLPTAEVALLVRDDHQGRGLGDALLRHLIKVAAGMDLYALRADVLSGNRRVIGLLRRNGGEVAWTDGRVRHFTIPLRPGTEARIPRVRTEPPHVRW